jgi:hypothetical protein
MPVPIWGWDPSSLECKGAYNQLTDDAAHNANDRPDLTFPDIMALR